MQYIIINSTIINEGKQFNASVLIKDDKIAAIYETEVPAEVLESSEVIDGTDCYLMPGVIDDHVHFRDPGFSAKADFETESIAAVAGGVTSVMDMPNTNPQTVTLKDWQDKMDMIATKSVANYSAYLGATANNFDELKQADATKICGIKMFLGASTGNMLVDDESLIEKVFSEIKMLIAVHAEDEATVKTNLEYFKELYKDKELPVELHSEIRSTVACFKSSEMAVNLAKKHGTRLHIMHVSSSKELELLDDAPIENKLITAETCPQYLTLNKNDYNTCGGRIKCNPAIKSVDDMFDLTGAMFFNRIDVIGTDHAPHLLEEKQGGCLKAVSGMPGIQFSLVNMLELNKKAGIPLAKIVEKMCHNPAKLFKIKDRGFIKEGYFADLVLVKKNEAWTLTAKDVLSKCGWSPYEGRTYSTKVYKTFVNGNLVYDDGKLKTAIKAKALEFKN